MTTNRMSYRDKLNHCILIDEKCAVLAKHFLSDVVGATADDERELAQSIQALCEAHCADIE